ncbi:3-phosphoshikimate 1-carboxyvinyltransferase [Engelhardtia mirabilis]|uniref:3-phosphoshikimate 1-carboxyvinyltransferase n=1 Tax=Engelhardtia mirabilis TaxID=2528011 RepID=A0A518BKF5_9BACT|nr:3-phosphoshikimate 1-carboxyvinyltransferase [Planctomycetes bacterium Pla133]QDV01786.1 3-phosphoshikimate 1-carboxyvinyltransferase [Planctomycetes bacterium Pla86]
MSGKQSTDNAGRRVDGFLPGGAVQGRLRTPPSKSIAQRALLAAALARGRTVFRRLGAGDDVTAACGAAAVLMGQPRPGYDRVLTEVTGRPLPHPRAGYVIQLGESATLARLGTGLLALCVEPEHKHVLNAWNHSSLAQRRSLALTRALTEAGAELEIPGPGTWPLGIHRLADWDRLVLRDPSSSQELTALVLAGAALGGERVVRVEGSVPSLPYLKLTAGVLATFGVSVDPPESADGSGLWRIGGELVAPANPLRIEPDASAAAVALAAACLSGGELEVSGLGLESIQGDVRIVEHLRAFGCETGAEGERLWARGHPRHPACVDLAGEPDLAPVLAAVAGALALADPDSAPTRLDGLGTLAGKESSRIEVLAEGLHAMGLAVEAGPDHLTIAPLARGHRPRTDESLLLDAAGDHRMAFAFGLLGLVRPGVGVLGADAVAKSWPGFWDDLERLGARRRG